jgi:N-acetylmuramate 1-kinase
MNRETIIAAFLADHGYSIRYTTPLAQDASFRRYLRLSHGPRPAVLMDAPPPENICPFLQVAAHLGSAGLSAPEIIAADETNGLILQEDLGDNLFAVLLSPTTIEPLFEAALELLLAVQRGLPPPGLPAWDAAEMSRATLSNLFDWWWPAAFGTPPPDAARRDIEGALADTLAPLSAGPFCFVHRDFFAGNLIWLPDRAGPRRVGIIDFQGAAIGHPAYDLVSLLQDARRDIPPAIAEHILARYLAARPELDPAQFRAAYAACAAQRHLRVAAQWVRLAQRDGRPQYLAHGPRTWRLLQAALQEPAAAALAGALDRWIPAEMRANPRALAA